MYVTVMYVCDVCDVCQLNPNILEKYNLETTMKHHYTFVWLKFKSKDMREIGTLTSCWWDCKIV